MLHWQPMRHLPPALRAAAAALLLWAGTAAWGAVPAFGSDDEAISALQAAYLQSVTPGEQADLHRDLLATVLQRIKRSHATQVDLPALAAIAIRAIDPEGAGDRDPAALFKKTVNETLRTLDRYARYIDPRALANERASASGSFGGLGIELQSSEGAIRVVAALPGSPAAKAGLAVGDLILRVDDRPLEGMGLADAIERLRGQPGTPVSVTVRRAGTDQDFVISITRDTIRRELLRWSLEDDVLVLRLSSFGGTVTASLAQAVKEATAQRQPRGVVLDLRGNPGGLLREGIRVADAFLSQGEIVSLHSGGAPVPRVWNADAEELLPGVPMLVLLDGRSASASELVADALQHHGRATVMGQRSYGKGTVQTTFSLGDDKGALKLTTATYHGPSGQTVQGVGVEPDVELVAPGGQAAARTESTGALATVREARPLRLKTRLDTDRCNRGKAPDPALACALGYLQASSSDAVLPANAE
jgi:carboxyl-terminal processing protease